MKVASFDMRRKFGVKLFEKVIKVIASSWSILIFRSVCNVRFEI